MQSQPTLVVGAGETGALIIREIRENPAAGMDPVAPVDDDPVKQGVKIHGVPVLGRIADIAQVVGSSGASLVVAMPTASGLVIRAVREQCIALGNVLGSRGSVVLTFNRQTAAGGPITVTHPDVRRFFMTIPEAVQLTLQAATLGQGGEVFKLDMGKLVKIADLTRDLIELSGLRPEVAIAIQYSGLRPGEKLYEELFIAGEAYLPTPHAKIFHVVLHNGMSPVALETALQRLLSSADNGDADGVLPGLRQLVPEYVGACRARCPAWRQQTGASGADALEDAARQRRVTPPSSRATVGHVINVTAACGRSARGRARG